MLAVREIAASGYRSLRRIGFPVEGLSVFVGGNGTGKTNLYGALELLQAAAGTSKGEAIGIFVRMVNTEATVAPDREARGAVDNKCKSRLCAHESDLVVLDFPGRFGALLARRIAPNERTISLKTAVIRAFEWMARIGDCPGRQHGDRYSHIATHNT